MDIALSNTIGGMSNYISEIKPDLIVVHGDRLEALAGAIVGAFNNILVAHIEGGEVSGTIDESIRHAITKFAHIHFVSNEDSKKRIIQMGENPENVFIIGSPDIDIMFSKELPTIEQVKKRYEIPFDHYAIAMYHPVTTEVENLENNIIEFINALIISNLNYVVIYPNNDLGSDIIIKHYERLKPHSNFLVFPSIRFEYFLTLLKYADFMIGNSSAGIRESTIYGTPTIDVGTRQSGRYNKKDNPLIFHSNECTEELLEVIKKIPKQKVQVQSLFGNGDSAEKFLELIRKPFIWNVNIQKKFSDLKRKSLI
jgi:UDP-N-acetylglucosamine 2-epimerase (hydrolysing)